jgi:hypothetical protein
VHVLQGALDGELHGKLIATHWKIGCLLNGIPPFEVVEHGTAGQQSRNDGYLGVGYPVSCMSALRQTTID